ncbi:Sensors of blue-light using FAD [Rhodovulum sp. ES.010]|uniref:BLUF domain-containing protein n=1 Tax=Rhodovulum sp. ES.010 TaxID=1882821 RepID=UPI00092C063A|nr:BLUF domain-containing protein [Rhodovulum sp. ES.010]SIO27578.1 Sensors of blue-light using FAD [Rhodovulum sp. ES.010]
MELHFVLYRSAARKPLDEKTVVDILAQSVRNNPKEGLTGFLHVDRGCFLQYLEGPSGPLTRMVARIQRDRRHKGFMILARGTIDERFFPDWEMGQISDENLPSDGILADRSWLQPRPDIDPLPLIRAFAAHAGQRDNLEIGEID